MPFTETASPKLLLRPPTAPARNPSLSNNLSLQAQTLLGSFGLQAQQQLQARGIHIPPAICLSSDAEGKLQLQGQHPQARQIRLWLGNSHELGSLFHELAVLFGLLYTCSPHAVEKLAAHDRTFCIGITSAGALAYFNRSNRQHAGESHG